MLINPHFQIRDIRCEVDTKFITPTEGSKTRCADASVNFVFIAFSAFSRSDFVVEKMSSQCDSRSQLISISNFDSFSPNNFFSKGFYDGNLN